MLPFAPRYDPRIVVALRMLDDRSQPVAEVCRRVGAAAERLGLHRPSYVHLRRLLVAMRDEEDAARERREAMRELLAETATKVFVTHRRVDAYDVAGRLDAIRRGEVKPRRGS